MYEYEAYTNNMKSYMFMFACLSAVKNVRRKIKI